jgi:hypothetical protein
MVWTVMTLTTIVIVYTEVMSRPISKHNLVWQINEDEQELCQPNLAKSDMEFGAPQ